MNSTYSSSGALINRVLTARAIKRISLAAVAAIVATIFVLAACSAPQNTNALPSGEQQSATDWKLVEQALIYKDHRVQSLSHQKENLAAV